MRCRVTYANVAATLALLLALGGGAYAVARSGNPVKGGGKVVSVVKDIPAGGNAALLNLGSLGKVSASCGADAKTSSWGFETRDRAAYVALADGSGSRIAGNGHGFATILGDLSGFGSAYVAAHISGTAGHPKPLANVTLSVVNDGYHGSGNSCRFAVQSTRQP
jgi:hypothetical protein